MSKEYKARDFCSKCGKHGDNKLCSACHISAYCCKECQSADWTSHKFYCKRWVYVRQTDLRALGQSDMHADPENSEIFRNALEAAKEKGEEMLVLMTPIAADKFCQALHDDFLPGSETEEKIWGLWGAPSSQPYQRLLTTYQKAQKFGDLSATKLMEALCARPHTSKALTDLLQNTKMVCTEQDSPESLMHVVKVYHGLVNGLVVDSEFDKWPIRS